MNFDCPYCRQNLDADDDIAGQTLKCPTCGNEIIAPGSAPAIHAEHGTKLCPYCSEPIKAAAIKCRHCGSMLDGGVSRQQHLAQKPWPLPVAKGARHAKPRMSGCFIMLIAIVAILFGLNEGLNRAASGGKSVPYIEANGGRVYYIAPATRNEAEALGNYLTPDLFDGSEKLVELSISDGFYCLLLPILPEYLNQQGLDEEAAILAAEISSNVFNNRPVRINFCDPHFNIIASFTSYEGEEGGIGGAD